MRTLALTLLLACMGCAAKAQVYNLHNNVTKMDVSGKQVEIVYVHPQKGVAARLGDKLFEGGVNERSLRIEGTVYAYSRGCKPVPYKVVGDFVGGDEQLVLTGKPPRIHPQLCTIVGWDADTKLVFKIDREPY